MIHGMGRRMAVGTRACIGAVATTICLAACSGDEGSTVPRALEAAGDHGEGAYEQIFADAWAAAHIQVDSLAADLGAVDRAVAGQAATKAELRSDLSDLEAAVASRDRHEALRLSNDVTRIAAHLSAPYHPPLPVGITLLDYYGRVLQLQAEAQDDGALTRAVAGLQGAWDTIRPAVEARPGGAAEAEAFGALVGLAGATTGPTAPATFKTLSGRILDGVDEVERLFPLAEAPD